MLALDLSKDYLANEAFSAHVNAVTYTDGERGHSWTRPGIPLTQEHRLRRSRGLAQSGQGVAVVLSMSERPKTAHVRDLQATPRSTEQAAGPL